MLRILRKENDVNMISHYFIIVPFGHELRFLYMYFKRVIMTCPVSKGCPLSELRALQRQ